MKNALFLFLGVLFFSSCVKPDAPQTYTPNFWNWTGTDPMSAEVNGVPWQCALGNAAFSDGNYKVITGFNNDTNTILFVPNSLTPGEYNLSKGNGANSAFYTTPSGFNYLSTDTSDGKLKIIENNDTMIKGLFYFNCVNIITGSLVKVTKGYFNIKNWNWTSDGIDPMSAEIDGGTWAALTAGYSEPTGLPYSKEFHGADAAGNSITITSNDFSVGEYDLYTNVSTSASYLDAVTSTGYSSSILKFGRVKVTENDATHIKGMFYFDGKSVTNGKTTKIRKGYFNITK